jgi:hypothetical protein
MKCTADIINGKTELIQREKQEWLGKLYIVHSKTSETKIKQDNLHEEFKQN